MDYCDEPIFRGGQATPAARLSTSSEVSWKTGNFGSESTYVRVTFVTHFPIIFECVSPLLCRLLPTARVKKMFWKMFRKMGN